MRLFGRKAAATLRLSPEGPLRPTDTVTVTAVTEDALDGVSAARVELGYVNGFRYRWAGRQDAMLNKANTSLTTWDQPDTSYGGEKGTTAWVHVIDAPLTVAAGVLGSGTHTVDLRLPSWSPGTSKDVVQWEARLVVERSGRDVEVSAPLTVLVPAPDPVPVSTDLPLTQGESALNDTLFFEVETERGAYRAGEEVRGTIAVTPRVPVTRTALFAGWFAKLVASHPLEKAPAAGPSEYFVRPMTTFAKDVQLVEGQRFEVPFAMTLPADAAPTTEAVHSSIDWFLEMKVEYAGLTGGIERARRGIVVFTG